MRGDGNSQAWARKAAAAAIKNQPDFYRSFLADGESANIGKAVKAAETQDIAAYAKVMGKSTSRAWGCELEIAAACADFKRRIRVWHRVGGSLKPISSYDPPSGHAHAGGTVHLLYVGNRHYEPLFDAVTLADLPHVPHSSSIQCSAAVAVTTRWRRWSTTEPSR